MRGSRRRWIRALGWFGLNVVGVWFVFSSFDSSVPAVVGVVVAAIGAIGFGAAMGFWGSLLYPVAWLSLAVAAALVAPSYECPGRIYSRAYEGTALRQAWFEPAAPSRLAVIGTTFVRADVAPESPCADGAARSRTSPLGWHALIAIMFGAPLALVAGGVASVRRGERRRRAVVAS